VGLTIDVSTLRETERQLAQRLAEIDELRRQLELENTYLRDEHLAHHHGDVIGDSPALRKVLAQVEQVAGAESTVLLLGETGTGKELVARAIHFNSHRMKGPFVAVNCAAIPEELIESELFGHEKGSFTGATASRPGLFRQAEGGTLLLDEITEFKIDLQPKLLRVLEERVVRPVGGERERPVDVRVIAATHRDLLEMCQAGQFREDLYYRLSSFVLSLPALRERKEDLESLCLRLLREASKKNKRSVRGISKDAITMLSRHDWPGNIRELKNVITRAVVIAEGEILQAEDLPARLRSTKPDTPAVKKAEIEALKEQTQRAALGEPTSASTSTSTSAASS